MTRPFRVQLIAPITEGFQGRNHVFSLPFQSLPTLAAYMPEGTEVEIVHEKHSDVDFEADVDLVALTVMTPCAPRAYEIGDRFRERGVPVVMGGVHVTVMPDEALEHADAICIGEGEQIWPQMVEDARAGRLQQTYRNPGMHDRDFSLRAPRRDLLPVGRYFGGKVQVVFIETSRGCPYDCDFCAVTTFFGQQVRTRPVQEVRQELEELGVPRLNGGKRSYFNWVLAFTDDNFFANRKHAAAMMEMLREYDVRWFGQTTLRMTERPELLDLCEASGCLGFEIGFESLQDKYRKTGRGDGTSQEQYYLERVKLLHDRGIGINGSFMFGNDDDDISVFERYVDFIGRAAIQTPYLTIRTPYPGTPLFYEFEEDDRLLHRQWEKYDTAHAVFRPAQMTAEQLEAGYRWAWRKVTRHSSMLSRNLFRGPLFRFWGAAALGFRMSVRAEHGGQERRHPSRLEGPDPDWCVPERLAPPVLPDHIQSLRATRVQRRSKDDSAIG